MNTIQKRPQQVPEPGGRASVRPAHDDDRDACVSEVIGVSYEADERHPVLVAAEGRDGVGRSLVNAFTTRYAERPLRWALTPEKRLGIGMSAAATALLRSMNEANGDAKPRGAMVVAAVTHDTIEWINIGNCQLWLVEPGVWPIHLNAQSKTGGRDGEPMRRLRNGSGQWQRAGAPGSVLIAGTSALQVLGAEGLARATRGTLNQAQAAADAIAAALTQSEAEHAELITLACAPAATSEVPEQPAHDEG